PISGSFSGSGNLNIFQPDSIEQIAGYPKAVEFNDEINLMVFEDTKSLMSDDGQAFVNTLLDQTLVQNIKYSFSLNFDQPVNVEDMPLPPFDPFLYTAVTGYELHLPGNSTKLSFSNNSGSNNLEYKDQRGYPYSLVFTDDWQPPIERVDLGDAYQNFLDYVNSAGVQNSNWYLSPSANKTKTIGKEFWAWEMSLEIKWGQSPGLFLVAWS
ncbi:MAG: LruC domain-containing protein, partial [Psychrosphaera sp.]|nr:LruC domain-containing protein [Psychrosphaera sp.]